MNMMLGDSHGMPSANQYYYVNNNNGGSGFQSQQQTPSQQQQLNPLLSQQMTPQYLQAAAFSDHHISMGQSPSYAPNNQVVGNSTNSGSSNNNNQAALDDQRRQDILMKLQQERELRRKYVQEGKANEFKLDTLSSARQQQQQQQQQQQNVNYSNNGQQQQQQQYISQSFDNRSNSSNFVNNNHHHLNDNESVYSGYSNQKQPPTNQTLSQQYNQGSANNNNNNSINKSYLVNKLLNERRASKQSKQYSINTSSFQLNQQSHTQSQISPNNEINNAIDTDNNLNVIGGFNPEALYQDDVVSTQQNDANDDAYSHNRQYLQQQQQQQQQYSQQILPSQHINNTSNITYMNQQQHYYQQQQQWLNQPSQQQQQQLNSGSNGNDNNNNQQNLGDQKYRDAVEYAKMQIQQELRKKQQLNQIYHNNDFVDSYPSDRIHSVIQSTKQQQQNNNNNNFMHDQAPEPERRGPPRPSETQQHSSLAQNYLEFNGGGLPPSVKQMDKNIANQSLSKTHQEMNRKTAQRSNKQANQQHHFNYESEDERYRMTNGGFGQRPQSATHRKTSQNTRTFSQGAHPPEYMKNTVNADLKREGQQAKVNKTKQLVTEAEKKFKEECTFKPQINDYSVAPSKEFSKEERWKKLTEPKTTEIQKRELIKAKLEQEEAQRNCPFKPQLPKSAKKSARKPTNKENETDNLPLPQRLMHEADIRKEKREKLKRELEQQQMKDCSFKPQLMTTSSSVVNINKFNNQIPIHERVNHLQKEKNEKLQKLRMKSEQEQQDLTFHPQVNQKSAKIATVKRMEEESRPKDVVERLYQDAANRIDKQMNHTESYHEQLNRDCSFQPHISKTSNYLSEKSDLFNGNLKDFYERQQAFLQKQQEKRQEYQQKYSQEAQCSFKPEINVTSDIIVESDPKRGAETEEERYYRLYKKDMKRQEIVKEMIEKEVYQQYTFKPQINKISKTLARGSSIDELAYNPKGQLKREQLQEELVNKEINYCTFRPETTKTKKYEKVESTYKFNDCESLEQFSMNLKQKLKEKQEKIAKTRKEREYEQQKDCTFKPQILDKEPATSKDQVVVVRGLGRHLELKELQKKKEEEKKLREAEVFGLNHKFAINAEELDITNPNRPQSVNVTRLNQTNNGQSVAYTVPQPFELSNNKQERKNKLLKELNEKERQECTFKPSTNEGRNRKLIKEILEETEDRENETAAEDITQSQLNYYQQQNTSHYNNHQNNVNHYSSNF